MSERPLLGGEATAAEDLPDTSEAVLLDALCDEPESIAVITATRRLARHLKASVAKRKSSAGASAFLTPDVMPLEAWWQARWRILGPDSRPQAPRSVLSPLQARQLWQSVIEEQAAAQDARVERSDQLAAAAFDAWMVVHEWRVPLPFTEPKSADAQRFEDWCKAYLRELDKRAWADPALLPEMVLAAIQAGKVKTPPHLVLAGFDELTPRTLELARALEKGAAVSVLGQPQQRAEVTVRPLADAAAEARAAAMWARARLERAAASVHIIAPDVPSVRTRLRRELALALDPQSAFPGGQDRPALFDVSLGDAAESAPPVRCALAVLALVAGNLDRQDIGLILRSPFVRGATAERSARAQLDGTLRSRGFVELNLQLLTSQMRSSQQDCSIMERNLLALAEASQRCGEVKSLRSFLPVMHECLDAVGWPNLQADADPLAQAAVSEFEEAAGELARLDRVVAAATFDDGVALLARVLRGRVVQVERADAPVKVLGVLESSGVTADHVWVLGLHDEAWPPMPAPSPFIPSTASRALGLPRASAEREAAFAAIVTKRLRAAGREVVFSYPEKDGDRDLLPSPLLPTIAAQESGTADLPAVPLAWQGLVDGPKSVAFADWQAAPVRANTRLRGGASVFSNQAACPFKGFATHRLRAEALEEPTFGLDPRERGQIVHKALELLFLKVRSTSELSSLPPGKLEEEAKLAAVRAARATFGRRPHRLPRFLRELEIERLQRLLTRWTYVERQRRPFTVESLESRCEVFVSGIGVKIRIDRIDRLADGRQVIVDYKTGSSSRSPLKVIDRPEEAQLPLYLQALGGDVAGVALARVDAETMKFDGVSDGDCVGPGVVDAGKVGKKHGAYSWQELTGRWGAALAQLAQEIALGTAHPEPLDGDATCRRCGLQSLCRIRELGPGASMTASTAAAAGKPRA